MTLNAQPTGVAANAYATVEEIDILMAESPIGTDDWDSATTAKKEKSIIHATSLIDANYDFKGAPYSVYQILKWPRVVDEDHRGGPRQPTYLSIYSKKLSPTWVESPTTSGEFYISGGDSSIDMVEHFVFDELIYPKSTVGSLPIGSFGIGDNDTLGYDTIYFVPHKRVSPSYYDDKAYICTHVKDVDGFDLKDFIYIPLFVKKAVAELCKKVVSEDITSNDLSDFNNIRIGPISISPRRTVKEINIPDIVGRLLKPYGHIRGSGTFEIGRG